jgi:MFS family permease
VLLKPVLGSLADRIGPRPVLLGGLVAFALASAAFVLAGADPGAVGLARFGQGAAAAAFSPAAGAMVARLASRCSRVSWVLEWVSELTRRYAMRF